MGDYKYLYSVDLDRILVDGTIRIRTLSYYRDLEGTQWIADHLEGLVKVKLDQFLLRPGESTAFAPTGYRDIERPPTAGNLYLQDVVLSYLHADVFIFCASRGDLSSLSETMCQNNGYPHHACDRYDACVRIADLEHLAHRIFHRGVIVRSEGTERVSDFFGGCRCGVVTYAELCRNQNTSRLPSPSPFLKDNDFRSQCEVRIAFYPLRSLPLHTPQTLTIKDSSARGPLR